MSHQNSFQPWLDLCIRQDDKPNSANPSKDGSDEVASRLRQEARLHFQSLSSSLPEAKPRSTPTSNPPTVEQDLSKASSATANGALALLVSSLGPAFSSSSSSVDAKVRALHCLIGALEGSSSLTQGVRQAVGRFLVELCRPESHDNESDVVESDDDMDQSMDYVDAANLTPEQVTRKLQAMEQAHDNRASSSFKRSRKSSSAFSHEDVRDASLTGMAALLRSRLDIFPTQQSLSPQKTSSPLGEAMGVVRESMELRIELAMLGVRYRCQTGKVDEGLGAGGGVGYEAMSPHANIEDGLSQLPRLKRSLCFKLFEGALDGFNGDELIWEKLESQFQSQSSSPTQEARASIIPQSLLRSMSAYASLISSCIHGETDPRCLLQLLCLLNKTQQILMPLFYAPKNNKPSGGADQMDTDVTEVVFPTVEIFDAVAPYYPVQFTPPKNDPHGITRDMLQDALMAVLCERGTFYISQSVQNENGSDGEEKETMMMLAGRMFLERLEPPKSSDYNPPSNGSESEVDDKLDAVRDLSTLFLPRSTSSKNGVMAGKTANAVGIPGPHYSPNVSRVTPSFMSELSSSMARVHEDAVSSDSKSLASAIRKFSSYLAHTLEPVATSNKNQLKVVDSSLLWEAYVVDVLRHLSPTLASAPQGMHGRASTAYLASLAAEGGVMTLNKVLEGCYPRFLGVLASLDRKDQGKESGHSGEPSSKSQSSKQKTQDEEKLAAAVRGIAALVSSCRVALHKHERENIGVKVHPHPLSPYVSATIQTLAFILKDPLSEDEIGSLSMAAVGALESVVISTDLNVLEQEDMLSLEKMFSLMSPFILSGDESDAKKLDEWKVACARVLGAVIAMGLSQENHSSGATMGRMNELASSLLPEVLASSATLPSGNSAQVHIRYDWMVLARACAHGTSSVSMMIVSKILSRMISALQATGADQRAPAMALSYLVQNGGPEVCLAFHSLSPPGPTPFDFINKLCQPSQQGVAEDSMNSEGKIGTSQLQVGLSLLQLPDSRAKDEEVAKVTMKRAYAILPFIIPAYEGPASVSSCSGLVQFVDQILPPLSKWDEVKLFVAFPLLAAVLNTPNQEWRKCDRATLGSLQSMITYLAQFSISPDHDARSRSAAASCLFSVLFESSQGGSSGGVQIFQKLLEEVVCPGTIDSLSCIGKEVSESFTPRTSSSLSETSYESMQSSFSQLEDSLNFMGLLGSAAACKGGPFSKTADEIASFFVELACTGTAQFPFTKTTIQLATLSEQGQKHPILSPESHAYVLPASAFGSMLSVHNGAPFWRQRMTHKTLPILVKALQMQAKSRNPPALGTLAVVCHMLCCLPSSLLGKSNIQQILPTTIAGLVYFSKNLNALAESEMISSKPAGVLSIILGSLIKILAVAPKDVTKFIGIIIPSLLLLCSPTSPSEAYIPKQLIVFQCLESITTLHHAHNSILREKDQVVAVLSSVMDHPSMIIRNAAVQVRNVWCTLK